MKKATVQQTEVLIIGGGLSGLTLATWLADRGIDFLLLEARDRFGGRILTDTLNGAGFDLGPAWFWPGQPRIASLIAKSGLSRFNQFSKGALAYEDERGQVQIGRGWASMEGSYRLSGGFGALIDALVTNLPRDRLRLSSHVVDLKRGSSCVVATTQSGEAIKASQTVLALPPRIAGKLAFSPPLPGAAMTALAGVPTWMAGQAKALAIYERPFWREAGLSGDAMSRRGPMVEIHDASPESDGPSALFGFVGVSPQARMDQTMLRNAVLEQLVRIFGPKAAKPQSILLKDWAFDAHTATELDLKPLHAHPNYGLPPALAEIWEGRLIFSGTETAAEFGGFLEGAIEAAEVALSSIEREKVSSAND